MRQDGEPAPAHVAPEPVRAFNVCGPCSNRGTKKRAMTVDSTIGEKDRDISLGFQRGEAWAFDAAARAHFQTMVHFVTHLIHDRDKAVDLVQEAFFLACRAHHQVDPRRPLGPWLFQIARNIAYKEHNRRKRRPEVSIEDQQTDAGAPFDPPSNSPDPRQDNTDREIMGRINALVDKIKPKYRDVLIMRVIEGMASEEVSKLLRIPVPTVNTRTHRALRELRRLARSEGIREEEWFT